MTEYCSNYQVVARSFVRQKSDISEGAAPDVLPLSDVVAVASGTPFVGGCVFSVLRFRFRTAAASSALCAFSRRRLCASSPVSGVPLAPSLPVLACAPAALAAVLRAVRAGFFGSPRHLSRLPMRRFGGAGAPFSTPVRAGSRIFRVFAVRAARSLRAFKTLLRALCAASGARFPVLKCPALFAPLALTRCVRLARRVFPLCKSYVHRRRPQHHLNMNFTPFVPAVKVKPLWRLLRKP